MALSQAVFLAGGGAVGAHKAGNGWPYYPPAGFKLEGPQHRVAREGAALDHDVLAQMRGATR